MANIKKRTRVTVYIGRFQPFHLGHVHILQEAKRTSDLVIVLIGSAFRARTIKNPFTFRERKQMIERWLHTSHTDNDCNVSIYPLRDQVYNNAKWLQSVQEQVEAAVKEHGYSMLEVDVGITGSDRDLSTWYLGAFPQFIPDLKPAVPEGEDLSSTNLRVRLFAEPIERSEWKDVSDSTYTFIQQFVKTEFFRTLCEEYKFNVAYKKPYARMLTGLRTFVPSALQAAFNKMADEYLGKMYDPTFMTADGVVIQSGHVLVVKRGALPGKGLWALPGGFVKRTQTTRTASIAEIIEETGIKLADGKRWREITASILGGSIVAHEFFEEPERSLRGRTFTMAYLYRLDDSKPLPIVKGQFAPLEDTGGVEGVVETADAFWLPISVARANSEMWFEDHLDILDSMLGMIKD
jgi:bifunctional NMN adenylyltransferase/nudix hydrolase